MIWPVLRAGIYWGIGAVQAVGELIGATRKLVRSARRGTLSVDDTEPIPLTRRSSELIAETVFDPKASAEEKADALRQAILTVLEERGMGGGATPRAGLAAGLPPR